MPDPITKMKTMRAARFHGPSRIQIDHIPIPPAPLPHEVTISPLWTGICGTDLHEYLCGPISISTPSRPHPITHEHYPLTLGHEFCGTVSVLPADYTGSLKLGMNVMVDPRLNCTNCRSCLSGIENMCEKYGFIGLHGGGGGGAGFSEFVNVAQRMCYVLPESAKIDDAVLIEPLAVGRHALRASGIDDSRWRELNVLVLGGGPIGLAVSYNLRAVGVKQVFLSEPTSRRRKMVVDLELIAPHNVLDPLTCSLPAEIRGKTAGRNVDVVFDCSGVLVGMEAGMESLTTKGIYVNVAGWEKPFTVPFNNAIMKELTIKFSMAYDNTDFRAVVEDFCAGKYPGCEQMITARISLDDVVEKGFEELIHKKDQHVKIVVTPRIQADCNIQHDLG